MNTYKYDYTNDLFFKVSLNEGVYSIVDGPGELPINTKNMSGVWNMDIAELANYGWWPQVKIGEDSVVGKDEKLIGPTHVVDPVQKVVNSTWVVEPKTQGELDGETAIEDMKISEGATEFANGIVGQLFFQVFNEVRDLQKVPLMTEAEFVIMIEGMIRIERA